MAINCTAVACLILLCIFTAVPRTLSKRNCHGHANCGNAIPVAIYGEAMCPDTRNLFTVTFHYMYENNMQDLFFFKFVPWGKATYDKKSNTITCQHGPTECQYNRLLSCALDLHRNSTEQYEYLSCILASSRQETDVLGLGAKCAQPLAFDFDEITTCYKGEKGLSLQLLAGEKTAELSPKLTWIPWVMVSGIPLYQDEANLPLYICAMYRGVRPQECKQQPPQKPFGKAGVLPKTGMNA